jgi:thiol-disulfide isomerase/thioredoxin
MTELVGKISNILPKNGFNGILGGRPLETKHIILIGLGLLLVAGLIYFTFYYNKNVEAFHANRENVPISETENQPNKSCTMMLFYVDWCPHCKTAKPEWNKMKDKYEGKTINGYKVNFTEYNCTKESPEIDNLLDQYKIEGYPTIKLVKDGQVIEYDAKPTESTMTQFLNTVL